MTEHMSLAAKRIAATVGLLVFERYDGYRQDAYRGDKQEQIMDWLTEEHPRTVDLVYGMFDAVNQAHFARIVYALPDCGGKAEILKRIDELDS